MFDGVASSLGEGAASEVLYPETGTAVFETSGLRVVGDEVGVVGLGELDAPDMDPVFVGEFELLLVGE